MSKEHQLVNTLTLESEKIDGFSNLLPKLRSSIPNYDVCAWDNSLNTSNTLFESLDLKPKKDSKELSRKPSLSPTHETRPFTKKENPKLKNSPTPLTYKIATIALNDVQPFGREKKLKKISERYKMMTSKQNFASVYFPHNKRTVKKEVKRSSVPDISNLLKLLKPEGKHPVKAMLVPTLRSRTDLYRSFTKKKERRLNFLFMDNMSPEPVKINLKAFTSKF